MAMAGAAATGRCLLSRPSPLRFCLLRAALSTAAPTVGPTSTPASPPQHELLLEHLCLLKDASSPGAPRPASRGVEQSSQQQQQGKGKRVEAAESFEELGLGEEVMAALGEMGISKPTEIQCVGVPAVLAGTSSCSARSGKNSQ